ncbi:hypothetical protein JCM8547_007826 [Rhodosporidiobolus lusitaniae]
MLTQEETSPIFTLYGRLDALSSSVHRSLRHPRRSNVHPEVRDAVDRFVQQVKDDLPAPAEGFLLEELYEDPQKSLSNHGQTVGVLVDRELAWVEGELREGTLTMGFLNSSERNIHRFVQGARKSAAQVNMPPPRRTSMHVLGHRRQLISHRQRHIYDV